MPTLRQLEAQFLRYEERIETRDRLKGECWRVEGHQHTSDCFESYTGPQAYFVPVDTLAEAHGVEFDCPKGAGDPKVAHGVICWSRSRGTPEHAEPGPGRWKMDGTSLDDLTLNADPPSGARSVLLNGGCGWHGFVTDGKAE